MKFYAWQTVITLIKSEMTMSDVSKKADLTYAHTARVLNQLKTIGYIEIKKKSKYCYITLTKKGKMRAEWMKTMMNEC